MKRVCILGATGSIGDNTLAVLAKHPDQFQITALTGATNVKKMAELCRIHRPKAVVMADPDAAEQLTKVIDDSIQVLGGKAALQAVASASDSDIVVAGIVGGAGLESTYAAVAAGKTVLLANKEALVMAGHLLLDAAKQSGAQVIPIDSEQNAMHQCLPRDPGGQQINLSGVERILLTGSGGPFLNHDPAALDTVTPDEACNHPHWRMGRKISVDSATLMNKGLEYIETCYLFGLPAERVEVIIHPQSLVHSMVTYRDGSVLAQMATPDMRVPIAYALGFPKRIESGAERLNLLTQNQLTFLPPDENRFPCLRLAREAYQQGGGHCIALNAANEEAVAAFLAQQMKFIEIPEVIERVLNETKPANPTNIGEVVALDRSARERAIALLPQLKT